jgi:hypothetical protein
MEHFLAYRILLSMLNKKRQNSAKNLPGFGREGADCRQFPPERELLTVGKVCLAEGIRVFFLKKKD